MPVEDAVDRIIENLDFIFDPQTRAPAGTGSTRQILIVRSAMLYTAAHVDAGAPYQPKRQSYIHFLGDPSPSSDVTNGYIRFASEGAMRLPFYEPTRKTINLWVGMADMPMTLAQVGHRERYLWLGEWDSGHKYGDLHSVA
jgi:hypothetical protein